MATEWKEAPATVADIAKELIRLYHPDLDQARIGFLFRDTAPVSGGRATWGQAEKVSPKIKKFIDLDFIIWFAEDIWITLADFQHRALVDHELCHCQFDDQEMSAKTRGHDVEEFVEIVKRHGFWRESLLMFEKIAIADYENLQEGDKKAAQLRMEGMPKRGTVITLGPDSFKYLDAAGKALQALDQADRPPEEKELPAEPTPEEDVLIAEAMDWWIQNPEKLGISRLQRQMRIGYVRAARLRDAMEERAARLKITDKFDRPLPVRSEINQSAGSDNGS